MSFLTTHFYFSLTLSHSLYFFISFFHLTLPFLKDYLCFKDHSWSSELLWAYITDKYTLIEGYIWEFISFAWINGLASTLLLTFALGLRLKAYEWSLFLIQGRLLSTLNYIYWKGVVAWLYFLIGHFNLICLKRRLSKH